MLSEIAGAMLISGGGTTMARILDESATGCLKGKFSPRLVIASRPDAGGIQKARDRGIDDSNIIVVTRKDWPDEQIRGEVMLEACRKRGVEFVGQYGWLPKTPRNVVEAYRNTIVNQHPGPLRPGRPGFGGQGMMGTAVHTAVLWFARNVGREFPFTEAIAQRVAFDYDEGAILHLKQVPIQKRDDIGLLQGRVLPAEHEVQVEALLAFAENRVTELNLSDIVLPEEVSLLEQAKTIATTLYPHG